MLSDKPGNPVYIASRNRQGSLRNLGCPRFTGSSRRSSITMDGRLTAVFHITTLDGTIDHV